MTMGPSHIPGVPYAAAPSMASAAGSLAWPPRWVVIHDTGNPDSSKENEASYAHTRPVKKATSAHAYIDNGGVLGSLRLDLQAWAAYDEANRHGIHLEMCLRGDRAATRTITAGLVRQLCLMSGIPMVKLSPAQVRAGQRGVCGHRDITLGLQVGDHSDPGADFPWDTFMQHVNQGDTVAGIDSTDPSYNDLIQRVLATFDNAATQAGGSTPGRANGLKAALAAIQSQANSNGSGISAILSKLATPPPPVAVDAVALAAALAGDQAFVGALASAVAAELSDPAAAKQIAKDGAIAAAKVIADAVSQIP